MKLNKDLENILHDNRVGEFSFFSFFKTYLHSVTKQNWDFIKNLNNYTFAEQHKKANDIFDELNEEDRKKYIIQLAADNHETHHFHQQMLLPTGSVVFSMFWMLLNKTLPVYKKISEMINNDIEPFAGELECDIPIGFKSHLDYYLCGALLPGKIDKQFGTNPLTYIYNFSQYGFNGKLPTVVIKNRTYPVGLIPILESWTWSLIKAQVYKQFPKDYFTWYENTKKGDSFWQYNLIENILFEIFGEKFKKLNPIEKHKIIAKISICSCSIDPNFTKDFFQRTDSQPGWHLLTYIESLWVNKEDLSTNGLVDVDRCCNSIYWTMKTFNQYSLVDRLCEIDSSIKENKNESPDDLLGFVWNYFQQTQFKVLKEFLNKNDTLLDSITYLNSVKREYIPRIPMCIARPPDSKKRRLAFPAERFQDYWFTWFILTQIYFNLLSKKKSCPIAMYDLDMQCKIEPSCFSMNNLLEKKEKCHIYTFFKTLTLRNYEEYFDKEMESNK